LQAFTSVFKMFESIPGSSSLMLQSKNVNSSGVFCKELLFRMQTVTFLAVTASAPHLGDTREKIFQRDLHGMEKYNTDKTRSKFAKLVHNPII